MTQIIEQIIHDIEQAPSTFANLAVTGDSHAEVYGPIALAKKDATPRYGFSDEAIARVESGDYSEVINGHNVHLCGAIFSIAPNDGDGVSSLPLMMRLARAGVIANTNYSEGQDLDAWSATAEAGAEMKALVQEAGVMPSLVKSKIRELLSPDSPVEAGRSLYVRVTENYR